MDVLNTTEEQTLEQLSVQSRSFFTCWFMRLLSIISYVYFYIFKSPEEIRVRSIKENVDPRLNFLIKRNLLKGDLKVDDVRRALCLDHNLGEEYEKHIIYLFKAFFKIKEHRKLYSVILEKFIQKLNSGSHDPDVKKKYDVTVGFNFRNEKLFDEDSRNRISNLPKFLVLRILPVGTNAIISFDDLDLFIRKIKVSRSKKEFNHENSLQASRKKEKTCIFKLEDSSESESSTEKDAPYKYIFPRGIRGPLYYDLRNKQNYCQNIEQELLKENDWEDFSRTLSILIKGLKAHLKTVYVNLYEIGGKDYEDYYCEFCATNVLREDFIGNFFNKGYSLKDTLKGCDLTQIITHELIE